MERFDALQQLQVRSRFASGLADHLLRPESLFSLFNREAIDINWGIRTRLNLKEDDALSVELQQRLGNEIPEDERFFASNLIPWLFNQRYDGLGLPYILPAFRGTLEKGYEDARPEITRTREELLEEMQTDEFGIKCAARILSKPIYARVKKTLEYFSSLPGD